MARAPSPLTAAAALLVCVVGSVRASSFCFNTSYVSTQLELMLAEYDRAELPPGAVRVKAALDVQHATIDDGTATVRLLAAMHLNWEDKRLSWNASSWGCHVTVTSAERLWLPDVNALNAVTRGNAAGVGLRARLFSEGRVAWVLRFDLTSPLSLALQAWPSDVQQVTFKFGSRHHGGLFNLSVEHFSHATVFESGTWELVKVSSTESTWRGGDVAAWQVTLRRRAAAHALAAGSVLAAAALLLISTALLPPAARPALAATAALIASLWLVSALARLPGASAAPQLMRVMGALCVCAALQGAGAALARRVASVTSPPPGALRSLVTAASSLCNLAPPDASTAEWSAWAAAAQLLDQVLQAAVLFTLFVLMCVYLAIH
ncbi:neuronal acetylcholine receptor subunit alpha-4-like isoform X1 [Maniola hyperantus]|uniref:neuronal acetylcholine receptor subunit alpha-4-like isoform X1 n=1 Tax=Aphantopus hyperantus TaxID=2795564 RepID=UPI00374901A2